MSPSTNQEHPVQIEAEVKIEDGRYITFNLIELRRRNPGSGLDLRYEHKHVDIPVTE